MITANFYKALAAWAFQTGSVNLVTYGGAAYTATATSLYMLQNLAEAMKTVGTSYRSAAQVLFGTGDVTPTFQDRALSGSHISNISAAATVTTAADDNGNTITALYTITNTGPEQITIKEVGLFRPWSNYGFLMDRTVLDSPVTIDAGGVGQVTYTIRLNYPTA